VNVRAAGEINRASLGKERRKAPIDLMSGGTRWPNPACRQSAIRNVLEVETCTPLRGEDTQQQTLQGDDYPIEYDSDRQPSLTNLSHD
jgi:hypothetical protein